jgi:3-dehydroquinate dehydratase/shikimate dehydrogenase
MRACSSKIKQARIASEVSLMNETPSALICVPVCERDARNLPQAIARAAKVADILELRLDCLEPAELETALRQMKQLLHLCPHKTIFTLRPREQGGHRKISVAEREHFWRAFAGEHLNSTSFADIELDLALRLMEKEELEWNRVICSHHDFDGIPAELDEIYERMLATPARILKIAVQADDATDTLPVFRLLERARQEKREMIAIAMGAAGVATRIIGAARGAFLTYGSLDEAHRTAPGQLSALDLRELYRLHLLNEETQITGLIGSPVAHSLSPYLHNAAFAAEEINAVYIPFEVRNLSAFIRRMVHPQTREIDWNLRGLSVTAPHKSAILEQLDWVEPSAREIGAVNTIVFKDGALYGYNTDAAAFLAPLQNRIKELRGARCAIIGSGGAARGALWSLRQAGAHVTIFARNQKLAQKLVEKIATRTSDLAGANFREFDVVINATPIGTRGVSEGETPAVADQLKGTRFAYDLVYNPTETRFLREARDAGCDLIGGLPMLVNQAAEQFKLWTTQTAPIELMREAAQKKLSNA